MNVISTNTLSAGRTIYRLLGKLAVSSSQAVSVDHDSHSGVSSNNIRSFLEFFDGLLDKEPLDFNTIDIGRSPVSVGKHFYHISNITKWMAENCGQIKDPITLQELTQDQIFDASNLVSACYYFRDYVQFRFSSEEKKEDYGVKYSDCMTNVRQGLIEIWDSKNNLNPNPIVFHIFRGIKRDNLLSYLQDAISSVGMNVDTSSSCSSATAAASSYQ